VHGRTALLWVPKRAAVSMATPTTTPECGSPPGMDEGIHLGRRLYKRAQCRRPPPSPLPDRRPRAGRSRQTSPWIIFGALSLLMGLVLGRSLHVRPVISPSYGIRIGRRIRRTRRGCGASRHPVRASDRRPADGQRRPGAVSPPRNGGWASVRVHGPWLLPGQGPGRR
jgi:hypothetical protein